MKELWAVLLALTALAFGVVPLVVPPFDGFAPDAFPVPQTKPPVQPAGYAFAIWGLIYVWLIVASIFGVVYRRDDFDWHPMRPMLTVSLFIGTLWIPVALHFPLLATGLLWLMLATAVYALFQVGDTDRWLQLTPVAIYTGWLTAASCVALGVMLAGYGLLPETLAALVAIGVSLVISLVVQYRLHRAPEYGITVIWALVGIIVANSQPFNVAVSGVAGLGILAILSLRGTDTE